MQELDDLRDLSKEQQWHLVGRIKSVMRERSGVSSADLLLRKMRARDDIYAGVAAEIDSLLSDPAMVSAVRAQSKAKIGTEKGADYYQTNYGIGDVKRISVQKLHALRSQFMKTGLLSPGEFASLVLALTDTSGDIDIEGGEKANTLLHFAALNGMAAIVQVLTEHGASVTKRNKYGLLPIDLAQNENIRSTLSAAAGGPGPSMND